MSTSSSTYLSSVSLPGAAIGLVIPGSLLWFTRPPAIAMPLLVDGSWKRPLSGIDAWNGYGWPALVGSSVLCALLGATIFWWWGKRQSGVVSVRCSWHWHEILLLMGVMLIGASLRLPLLSAEMHRDEQDNLVHQIQGMFKLQPLKGRVSHPTGPPPRQGSKLPEQVQTASLNAAKQRGRAIWQQRQWSQTLLESPSGNNSPLNSILSRLCNAAWQKIYKQPITEFNLIALRIPAFIAITLATLLLFALLRRWFSGWAPATLGTCVFIFHPLVIRYGSLSRGYALMILFLILALHAYTRAAESPFRTCWWLYGALAMALAVYCFQGLALTAVLLCCSVLFHTLLGSSEDRWKIIRSWAGAHLLAGACWLPLGLPMAVQTAFFMAYDYSMQSDTLAWVPRLIGAGTCGLVLPTKVQLPFTTGIEPTELWWAVWHSTPGGMLILVVLVPCVLLIGVRGLLRSHHLAAFIVSSLVVGALISSVMATEIQHKQLLYWYGCYLVVVCPISFAALLTIPTADKFSFYRTVVVTLLACLLLATTFPTTRPGRLPLYPVAYFHEFSSLYRGYWIISSHEGINVSIPAR